MGTEMRGLTLYTTMDARNIRLVVMIYAAQNTHTYDVAANLQF